MPLAPFGPAVAILLLLSSATRVRAQEIAAITPDPTSLGPVPRETPIFATTPDGRPTRQLMHRSLAAEISSGFEMATDDRWANLLAFHKHYAVHGDAGNLIGWTGDLSICDPGTVSSQFHDLVLRRINYFRGQAGLSTNIQFDQSKNQAAQEAALVMARERALSHTPLQDFPQNPCVTAAIETAASSSNLTLGSFGYDAIDRLILDDGPQNGAVGHRRWLFYPRAQEMGHGSIPWTANHTSASAIWVIGNFAASPPPRPVTWPNEGYCPHPLVPNEEANFPRWSFSYPGADFSKASVAMTFDGDPIATIREAFHRQIGDNALAWRPADIPSTPPATGRDAIAHVAISGIQNAPFDSYAYDVRIYDPFDLQQSLTITGPSAPTTQGKSVYHFTPIDGLDGYLLRIGRLADSTWEEGAEHLTSIIDRTSASYNLQSTALASSGNHSFHLLFPDQGSQSFEIDRSIVAKKNSVLQFKYRFRFFFPHSRLRVEVSDSDGTFWRTIWEQAGTNASGSSSEWDSSWIAVNEPIPPEFQGASIRIRFQITANGSFYQWNEGNNANHYGAFLDDVRVSHTSQILDEHRTELDAGASSFVLNESIAGAPLAAGSHYTIQVAPVIGGSTFAYSSPLTVQPTEQTLTEEEQWLLTHFGTTEPAAFQTPEADFDQDGIGNLLERALGSDPKRHDEEERSLILPSGEIGPSGHPFLAFTIPSEPHNDLTYEVQQSTDLRTWNGLARKRGKTPWEPLRQGVTIDDRMMTNQRVSVRIGAPHPANEFTSFSLRLQVSKTD